MATSEDIQGTQVRRLTSWNRPKLQTVSGFFFLALLLLSYARRFDVIHVHQYGWCSTVAIILGRVLGRPALLKLTRTGPQGISAVLNLLHGTGFHVRLHRRLSACIATSQRAREEIIELDLAADRVHFIPNGLDTRAFVPALSEVRIDARRQLGLGDEPLALTVCHLRPEKNLPMLVDAWKRVQAVLPAARPIIVGDGPGMTDLKDRVERLGLEGAVITASDIGLLVPLDDSQALGEAAAEILGSPEHTLEFGFRARE